MIFTATGQFEWMAHHACVPIPDLISENVLRIYFGPRDSENRTRVAFIEVDAAEPSRVLYVHERPVLDVGVLGAFDDSGVMPSCIVNHRGAKYLYYIGWNRTVTVPYRNAIGLAISTDGGLSFQRACDGPVLDRSMDEPFFCASPFCLYDADELKWKLWYASGTGWVTVRGKPEPLYQIRYAESADGLQWRRDKRPCIDSTFDGEANARPCVVKQNGRYRMWFCFRGSIDYRTHKDQSYRIGYAESADGKTWERKDAIAGINPSESGWDSAMIEYPYVYEHRGRKFMLYNGNGFGETGFGYAVLDEDG